MQKKTYWFTLIETIITTVVMSILIWLVFEIYVVIGRMAVFIQWQKELHNELIYIVQTIQNLVDDQDVLLVFDDSLSWKSWFSETLKMEDDIDFIFMNRRCGSDGLCYIEMEKENKDNSTIERIPLTSTWSVHIEQFYIKALPFIEQGASASFEETMHDGFWFFVDARVPFFDQTKRWFRVSQKVQIFFTLRKY